MVMFSFCLFQYVAFSQNINFAEADAKTFDLYNKAQWKDLLQYGKQVLQSDIDYLNLRLRLGYAAYMTGNYAEAMQQYKQALKHDSYNSTAQYYLFKINQQYGRAEDAAWYAAKLSKQVLEEERYKRFALTGIMAEYSQKLPDAQERNYGMYAGTSVFLRLTNKLHTEQAFTYYNQDILTPPAPRPSVMNIHEWSYFGKLAYNVTSNLAVKASYHYLNTNFGTQQFNNQVVMAGLKWSQPYYDVQGDVMLNNLTNNNINQYNFRLGAYPFGNMNLYGFSRISLQTVTGSSNTLFAQVLGFKLLKNTWVEANITTGTIQNFAEHDGLYVYNSIDASNWKGGATVYYSLGRWMIQANYTMEEKSLFQTNRKYNQNSITGGLTCKF